MITIDAASSLKSAKVIEVVDGFYLLKATINSKGNEIYHKAEVDRVTLKILAKISICYYFSVLAKTRILQFYGFLCSTLWKEKLGFKEAR